MVYDEGFDIIFNKNNSIKNDRSYFVFSKYGMNNEGSKSIKSKWVSYCYSTLIGWYHIGNKWGCMYGYKLGVNKDEVTNGEAENKLNVVQGEITRRNKDDEGLYTQQKYYMDESSSNGEKVEADSFEAGSTQSSYIKVSESGKNNLKKESAFLETKFESEFTEKNEMLLTSTTTFTYNAMLVEAINSENLLFKAENYEEFSKMSFKELNKFAGRIKRLRNKKTSHKKRNGFSSKKISELGSFIQKKSNKLKISKDKENLMAINDIPENFSWAEKMSSPRSQVKIIFISIGFMRILLCSLDIKHVRS